jgi:uncharacterized protein (TIGR02453 family)
MARQAYFTAQTLKFLRELAKNNNRDWFQANKPRFEEQVRDPFLRLIGDLQAPLAKVSTHYRADPKPSGGSMFRIHRDTRFSKEKTPYKTWAGARLFHERARQVEAPSFYIHIQPRGCFVAAGLWHPQPDTLRRVREFLANNPAAWLKATRSPAFRRRFELGGDALTRPPRGYDPNHPAIEDIKRKDIAAWANFGDAQATATNLREHIAKELSGLAPMVDYLCAALDVDF